MRLGMGAAQIMPARPHFTDRRHRLRLVVDRHPGGHLVKGAELVGVDHEFLEARHQPALEPAAGVEHEVDARQKPHVETVCAFETGLRVGQFRAGEGPRRTVGQPQAAGQLANPVGDLAGLRRAERGRA